MGRHHAIETTLPTQVRHPWRSTVRVVTVAALALLPALPDLAAATEIDEIPLVISVLAVAAAVQRVITIPTVDAYLARLGLGAKDRSEYMKEADPYAA